MSQISILHDLAKKGFLAEILCDGWGNYSFKDGKPDYATATPADADTFPLGWRGCFWFFDKETNKLVSDDVGCYCLIDGGAEKALERLVETYEALKDQINPDGFCIEEPNCNA